MMQKLRIRETGASVMQRVEALTGVARWLPNPREASTAKSRTTSATTGAETQSLKKMTLSIDRDQIIAKIEPNHER